jgi:Transglycosylase-like domain
VAEASLLHSRLRGGWHERTTYLGGPSSQHGGFQIAISTWATHAPTSWPRDPASATPARQLYVAWLIWKANGRSWGANNQWPQTAKLCHVR